MSELNAISRNSLVFVAGFYVLVLGGYSSGKDASEKCHHTKGVMWAEGDQLPYYCDTYVQGDYELTVHTRQDGKHKSVFRSLYSAKQIVYSSSADGEEGTVETAARPKTRMPDGYKVGKTVGIFGMECVEYTDGTVGETMYYRVVPKDPRLDPNGNGWIAYDTAADPGGETYRNQCTYSYVAYEYHLEDPKSKDFFDPGGKLAAKMNP